MSFPTKPAFVVYAKGWDDATLAHPMMRFLHEHEKDFDAKNFEAVKPMYAADAVYVKADGTSLRGDAAFDALVADYALFAEHFRWSNPLPTLSPDIGWILTRSYSQTSPRTSSSPKRAMAIACSGMPGCSLTCPWPGRRRAKISKAASGNARPTVPSSSMSSAMCLRPTASSLRTGNLLLTHLVSCARPSSAALSLSRHSLRELSVSGE